ncbi:MAG: hypothetical protein U1D06_13855 [Paracoccaceae bacterium]|nr:hypothetical protein [Paracoccaceae bacterium]
MPKLIRLYIVSVAIGFGIAVCFVSLLVWQDVANLRHLIFGSELGWVAFLMMVMFHGVVFAGVQFGIAVMRLAAPEDGPRGGKRLPPILVPVRVAVKPRR